jgi:hypothetical protein
VASQPVSPGEPKLSDQPRPAGLVGQHLPLALTALVFVLVVVRLLRVSNLDAVTARAILANAGPTQVILGTILYSLPVLLPLFLIVIPIVWRMIGSDFDPFPGAAYIAFVLLMFAAVFTLLIALFTLPWVGLVLVLSLALVLGFMVLIIPLRVPIETKEDSRNRRERQGRYLAVAVVLLVSFFASGDEPWLPAEAIELRRNETIVGYVLDESDTTLVVLGHKDRKVTRVALADVESREICRTGTAEQAVIHHGADYERCPD